MDFGQKNFSREIDLFDFMSFFGLDSLNFLALKLTDYTFCPPIYKIYITSAIPVESANPFPIMVQQAMT